MSLFATRFHNSQFCPCACVCVLILSCVVLLQLFKSPDWFIPNVLATEKPFKVWKKKHKVLMPVVLHAFHDVVYTGCKTTDEPSLIIKSINKIFFLLLFFCIWMWKQTEAWKICVLTWNTPCIAYRRIICWSFSKMWVMKIYEEEYSFESKPNREENKWWSRNKWSQMSIWECKWENVCCLSCWQNMIA